MWLRDCNNVVHVSHLVCFDTNSSVTSLMTVPFPRL